MNTISANSNTVASTRYGMLFLSIASLFLVMVGYQISASRATAKEAALANARNLTLVLESKLNAQFSTAARTTSELASTVSVDALRASEIGRYQAQISTSLRDRVKDIPTASALRYFDAKGEQLYSSRSEDAQRNIANRVYFRAIKENPALSIALSRVDLDPLTGHATLHLVKPIRDGQGRLLGVAEAAIDLASLHEHFRSIEIGSGGVIALRRLDDGASVVRFPGPIEVDNKPALGLPVRVAILNDKPFGAMDIASRVDGNRRIYGYARIGAFPLFVAVGIAATDYLSEWRRDAYALLGASLLFLAIIGIVFQRLALAESKRNTSEGKLREIMREQNAVLDSHVVGIAKIKDRKFLWVNDAFAEAYGYTKAEMIGQPTRLGYPSDEAYEEFGRNAYPVLTQGRLYRGELRSTKKNGEIAWFSVSGSALHPGSDESIWSFVEVTDRKRFEQALTRSEQQLMEAQRIAHLGSWEYDFATKELTCSEETLRIYGLDVGHRAPGVAELLARVAPDDRSLIRRSCRDALSARSRIDLTHQTLASDGMLRYIHLCGETHYSDDGTPLRLAGTVQDVTTSVLQEKQLKESEERFRHLTALSSDWYWEQDKDHRFTFVSPGVEVQQCSAADHIGRTRWELPHVEPDPDTMREHDALLAARMPFKDLVIRSLGRNKEVHYSLVSGEPVFDEQGHYKGYRGVGSDITEQKRRQDEYRSIIKAATDGFWITDSAGRILDANDAISQILGYSRDELLRLSIRDIDADESPDVIAARTREIVETGSARFQVRHRRKDGTIVDVEVSALHVPALGQRFFAFVRDISERKAAEQTHAFMEAPLRESQKMEALGTLAGGVAHDFNNIVAAIMGNVELAQQDVGPDHLALESLEEIKKAGRRAKALVDQILAFSRRRPSSRQVISLSSVLDESARLLRSTLPVGVRLNVDHSPDAPPVLADATQIEQILLNLCGNAWQAMQGSTQQGLIEVRLDRYDHVPGTDDSTDGPNTRSNLRAGRYACLTVSDNGPGMDQATLSRIFEPFFTTKPVGKGTGLGLAVVHGIVQNHRASIRVESLPGKGTTFRIYFPAAENPVALAAAPAPRSNPARSKDKHVLYVDDDESIVFLMTRLLERHGYRVSGYTDAQAAISAVRARPSQFDLVVTDYNMPGMSGLEVAQSLKEIKASLPVAMASGYITDELRSQAPAAGVSALIYKPNTVDELCEAVARLAAN